MAYTISTSVLYEACDNAEDKHHEDYCLGVIPVAEYDAKRKVLIGDLAWDLGRQRPKCDPCEQAYADGYYG